MTWAWLLLLLGAVADEGPGVGRVRAEAEPCHPLLDAWLRASGARPRGSGGQRVQTGTAFVIAEGRWATAAHTVEGAGSVRLHLGEAVHQVQTLHLSPVRDLAILHAPTPLPPLTAAPPTPGAPVTASGFGGDGPLRQLEGIAIEPLTLRLRGRPDVEAWRVSLPVTRGTSGAPVLDADGRRVGMVLAGSRPDSELTGDGVMLPEPALSQHLHALGSGAGARRAGVRLAWRDGTAEVVVTEPDGPADQAGWRIGDRLLTADEAPIRALSEAASWIALGASTWRLRRGAQIIETTLF